MYEIYQRLLDEKCLKNSDVSRGANVSNMTLSDWKHGKTTPKTDTMQKIADFLNVSVDYLMTGKDYSSLIGKSKKDAQLTELSEKSISFALKFETLTKEKQELIMQMIDELSN